MSRTFVLLLAATCAVVCFAEEDSKLDSAAEFNGNLITKIENDINPLNKMLPLEEDTEKHMARVKTDLMDLEKGTGNNKEQAKANSLDKARAKMESKGGKGDKGENMLGESDEKTISVPQSAIVTAAGEISEEVQAAINDEKKQQKDAKLAMTRINFTLAAITKQQGQDAAAPPTGPLAHQDGEETSKSEAVDGPGHGEPNAMLGESIEAQWTPLENAADQLNKVYLKLEQDTKSTNTQDLLTKMAAEDQILLNQGRGLSNQDAGKVDAEGKSTGKSEDKSDKANHDPDEELGAPDGEGGEKKEGRGALSGLQPQQDQAKEEPEKESAAENKSQLKQEETSEVNMLLSEEAVVMKSEKADEKEVTSLIGKLS